MSGDIERDAELFNDQSRYPEHLRTPPEKVLSANQLIAFNMWRARRGASWSQQEVAELLEMYTGRSWSNASVSAAERSWQGGRPRRFDANEILALSKIFDEPIAYFFLPPEDTRWNRKNVGMREFPDERPNMNPEDEESDLMSLIPTADYIGSLGFYRITPAQKFRIQELALQHLGLSWTPPEWSMPFKPVGGLEGLHTGPPVTPEAPEGKPGFEPGTSYAGGTIELDKETGEKVLKFTFTEAELMEKIEETMQKVAQRVLERLEVQSESGEPESTPKKEEE